MSYAPNEGNSLSECRDAYNRYYESGLPNYPTQRMRGHRLQIQWAQQLISLAGWNAGDHILDLGCGIGYYSHILTILGLKVTAIDFSPTAIAIASERYRGPSYIEQNAIDYQPDAPFDGIFSKDFSLFHHELDATHWGIDIRNFSHRLFSWLPVGARTIIHTPQNLEGIRNHQKEHFVRLFEEIATVTHFRSETRRIHPRQRATQVYALAIIAERLKASEPEPEPEPNPEPPQSPTNGYGPSWGYNP